MRREIGSASAAAEDPLFQQLLYETLLAWGIGQRGSILVGPAEFARALEACKSALATLEDVTIDSIKGEDDQTLSDVWQLISSLPIVENEARLVACTKALHHILPDLVVPMDREFTRTFFGWHVPEFQYQQEKVFRRDFKYFVEIAKATNPARFVGSGWKTSRTKVIDNALVGFCRLEHLLKPT